MGGAAVPALSCQAVYAQRWGHLHNPHVRALAWLLDAPDLLDAAAPDWAGQLAAPTIVTPDLRDWLDKLDRDSAPLLAALGERPFTRLGLYAEKLMAFFYAAQGRLVAHGLQVRASRNDTVGEFDFLLEDAGGAIEGVEHIELATKFYLLEGTAPDRFDTLVGPNLADSLGAKMRKIVGKQLTLSQHPAAQALLSRPVLRARALVKGWLFYPAVHPPLMAGIAPGHCRGFWRPLQTVAQLSAPAWVILPRLQWLAPYRLDPAQVKEGEREGVTVFDASGLAQAIAAVFEKTRAPVLVASMRAGASGELVEESRGFIVPDDWQAKAAIRLRP